MPYGPPRLVTWDESSLRLYEYSVGAGGFVQLDTTALNDVVFDNPEYVDFFFMFEEEVFVVVYAVNTQNKTIKTYINGFEIVDDRSLLTSSGDYLRVGSVLTSPTGEVDVVLLGTRNFTYIRQILEDGETSSFHSDVVTFDTGTDYPTGFVIAKDGLSLAVAKGTQSYIASRPDFATDFDDGIFVGVTNPDYYAEVVASADSRFYAFYGVNLDEGVGIYFNDGSGFGRIGPVMTETGFAPRNVVLNKSGSLLAIAWDDQNTNVKTCLYGRRGDFYVKIQEITNFGRLLSLTYDNWLLIDSLTRRAFQKDGDSYVELSGAMDNVALGSVKQIITNHVLGNILFTRLYNDVLTELINGEIDKDSLYLTLTDGSNSFDPTHTTLEQALGMPSSEVTNGGWPLGGVPLENRSVSASGDQTTIESFDDLSRSLVDSGVTIGGAIIYENLGSERVVAYLETAEPIELTANTDLDVIFTSGLFKFSA